MACSMSETNLEFKASPPSTMNADAAVFIGNNKAKSQLTRQESSVIKELCILPTSGEASKHLDATVVDAQESPNEKEHSPQTDGCASTNPAKAECGPAEPAAISDCASARAEDAIVETSPSAASSPSCTTPPSSPASVPSSTAESPVADSSQEEPQRSQEAPKQSHSVTLSDNHAGEPVPLFALPAACLFVASLLSSQTEQQLAESVLAHFKPHGRVLGVKVCKDLQQRPYAFVQYDNTDSAQNAMDALQKSVLDGRKIRVEPARVNRSLSVLFRSDSHLPRSRVPALLNAVVTAISVPAEQIDAHAAALGSRLDRVAVPGLTLPATVCIERFRVYTSTRGRSFDIRLSVMFQSRELAIRAFRALKRDPKFQYPKGYEMPKFVSVGWIANLEQGTGRPVFSNHQNDVISDVLASHHGHAYHPHGEAATMIADPGAFMAGNPLAPSHGRHHYREQQQSQTFEELANFGIRRMRGVGSCTSSTAASSASSIASVATAASSATAPLTVSSSPETHPLPRSTTIGVLDDERAYYYGISHPPAVPLPRAAGPVASAQPRRHLHHPLAAPLVYPPYPVHVHDFPQPDPKCNYVVPDSYWVPIEAQPTSIYDMHGHTVPQPYSQGHQSLIAPAHGTPVMGPGGPHVAFHSNDGCVYYVRCPPA